MTGFFTDGYAILERAIDPHAYDDAAARVLAQLTDEERAARRSTGSLVSLWRDPAFAPLIGDAKIIDAIRALGFARPRYSNGYVISKPARSPRTFWHEDWWGWNDPASYTPFVHQIGALFYTTDTARENGCLRVIPGSHRRRTAMHVPASDERYVWLRRGEDESVPEFADAPEEVAIPMRAGDLVLLDVRLLHAAHANTSDHRRTGILGWYIPDYDAWSEDLKKRLPNVSVPETWPHTEQTRINALLPPHAGTNTPAPIPYGLEPGAHLVP